LRSPATSTNEDGDHSRSGSTANTKFGSDDEFFSKNLQEGARLLKLNRSQFILFVQHKVGHMKLVKETVTRNLYFIFWDNFTKGIEIYAF
jgi:hypothetical protein